MKKFLSLFLAALILMSTLTVSSAAIDRVVVGYFGTGVKWTLYNGILKIEGKITGILVTNLTDKWLENRSKVKKVYIEDSVDSIGNRAFENCKNLKLVVIKGTMRSVSNTAFRNCPSLEKIQHFYGTGQYRVNYVDNSPFGKLVHPIMHVGRISPSCFLGVGHEEGDYCLRCEEYVNGGAEIPIKHPDEDNDGVCDLCKVTYCTHKCHDKSFWTQLWWAIELIFSAIFGLNQICECGTYHYTPDA